MNEPRTHRRANRRRAKNFVPLSILRMSEAVRTVVQHPRRLDELVRMLGDKDLAVRGRAAAALAKLSESHPARLGRILARLKEALPDDSARVRWHLVYTLGRLGSRFPAELEGILKDLVPRLEDANRIVRILACRTLGDIAARRPSVVEGIFEHLKKDVPPSIARILRSAKKEPPRSARCRR